MSVSENSNITINHEPSKGELTVLFSGYSQTLSGHAVGPTIHDYILIHTIISGKGAFTSRDTTYELSRGDSFFIFSGELISYEADQEDPWSYRWVALRGTQAEKMLADLGIGPHKPVTHHSKTYHMERLFARIQASLDAGGKIGDMEAEALLRLVFVEYGKLMQPRRPISMKARSVMEQQVEEAVRFMTLRYSTNITIEQLAQQYGYHRTYFSKMFHEIMGETPLQMLIRLRMERARTLLVTTKLSIEQIASSVGYSDALYFSKGFKRLYGESPSMYRKLHHIPIGYKTAQKNKK